MEQEEQWREVREARKEQEERAAVAEWLEQQIAQQRQAAADEVQQLGADLDKLYASHNKNMQALGEDFAAVADCFRQQDAEIDRLKRDLADVHVRAAEARVEDLQRLHSSLVGAVKMAVDTANEISNFNSRRAEAEEARCRQLAGLQAKADQLAAEVERLRTREDFKFAREQADSDMLDLPAFLPALGRN